MSYVINNAQDLIDLPSIVFSSYYKHIESKITLNFNTSDINPNIRDLLDYIKSSPVGVTIPELKDVLIITDRLKDTKLAHPDVKVISVNEVLSDFECILNGSKCTSLEDRINIRTNYDLKVVITDIESLVLNEYTELVDCISIVSGMIIELNRTISS